MSEYRAFTLHSKGILDRLPTNALVISDIRNKENTFVPKMWSAIWDTGASKSCITESIVKDLSLIPVGKTSISTANGAVTVDTYFVNIGLPNGVMVPDVLVSCADLGKEIDVLIGMDIITMGDFSITNISGRTTFTFRIPSVKEVDFVDEYNRESLK